MVKTNKNNKHKISKRKITKRKSIKHKISKRKSTKHKISKHKINKRKSTKHKKYNHLGGANENAAAANPVVANTAANTGVPLTANVVAATNVAATLVAATNTGEQLAANKFEVYVVNQTIFNMFKIDNIKQIDETNYYVIKKSINVIKELESPRPDCNDREQCKQLLFIKKKIFRGSQPIDIYLIKGNPLTYEEEEAMKTNQLSLTDKIIRAGQSIITRYGDMFMNNPDAYSGIIDRVSSQISFPYLSPEQKRELNDEPPIVVNEDSQAIINEVYQHIVNQIAPIPTNPTIVAANQAAANQAAANNPTRSAANNAANNAARAAARVAANQVANQVANQAANQAAIAAANQAARNKAANNAARAAANQAARNKAAANQATIAAAQPVASNNAAIAAAQPAAVNQATARNTKLTLNGGLNGGTNV